MAFIRLENIGKIYVSGNNVAVGIRGVNLTFERGEFVAITGQSGSGKSTLLNVLSGIDTYEEGEMYVEGQPTSHYLQPEWEEYRQKYISFVFQDYNIIDSYTVLQNVELALLHITDRRIRRARALELISRVGMSDRIRQKGSQLSGGQKQRTVIARALAKDSPVILADEPTGNLDSVTAGEIVALLHEVSKDKLVIVVTHNYDQLEGYADRHIRIFDGAVESDRKTAGRSHAAQSQTATKTEESVKPVPALGAELISENAGSKPENTATRREKKLDDHVSDSAAHTVKQTLREGWILGHTMFTARPRLTAFLCFLLAVGTLGIFLVTALFGEINTLFEKNYMFTPLAGRAVVTRQDGTPLTDDETAALAARMGATEYLRVDYLLDRAIAGRTTDEHGHTQYVYLQMRRGNPFSATEIIGRAPEHDGEVLLNLPISKQPLYGRDAIVNDRITINNTEYRVTGVHYYYDHHLQMEEAYLTDSGFSTLTATYLLMNQVHLSIILSVSDGDTVKWYKGYRDEAKDVVAFSFNMGEEDVYININEYDENITAVGANAVGAVEMLGAWSGFSDVNGDSKHSFDVTLTGDSITAVAPATVAADIHGDRAKRILYIDTAFARQLAETYVTPTYRQASLFFPDTATRAAALETMNGEGYVAVAADTEYENQTIEEIFATITLVGVLLLWLTAIVFLGLFVHLCTSRTLDAMGEDMAIMRSMGISIRSVKWGMYVKTLLSLFPAYPLLAICATLIYRSPRTNDLFTFLVPWQYALIAVGMLILALVVTHRQIKRLFHKSVKRALNAGRDEK